MEEATRIPEGKYKVVVAHLEPRTQRTTGRPYFMATYVVIEGKYAGTLLFHPLVDSDLAAWIYTDVCHDLQDLFRKIVYTEVRTEEFNGVRRSKAGKLTPVEDEQDLLYVRFIPNTLVGKPSVLINGDSVDMSAWIKSVERRLRSLG